MYTSIETFIMLNYNIAIFNF